MLNKLFPKKRTQIIFFRLTEDALVYSLIGFSGLMTLDALMPGFVSGHISLAKASFFIAALWTANRLWQWRFKIPETKKPMPKWLLIGLLFWTMLLILNSLIKFPAFAIGIIFLATAFIGKLLYDEMFLAS